MARTQNAPVEQKVKWSTYMATLAGAAVALLNLFVADSELLGALPPWAQFVVTLVVPPLVVLLGGYQASHTPRPTP